MSCVFTKPIALARNSCITHYTAPPHFKTIFTVFNKSFKSSQALRLSNTVFADKNLNNYQDNHWQLNLYFTPWVFWWFCLVTKLSGIKKAGRLKIYLKLQLLAY
jgi:hypothetical protein